MQAGGAQMSFQVRVPCLCAARAPPWGMSACKGEGISTGASVHMENPHFPPISSVAKATVFIRMHQGFVRTTCIFCTRLYP